MGDRKGTTRVAIWARVLTCNRRRARPLILLHVSLVEDNSGEHQPRYIGVVETTANQDRTGVQIKTKKKNQQEEQEYKECDARVTPCREETKQEQEMAEGQMDQARDRSGNPDARQDMAHAHARATITGAHKRDRWHPRRRTRDAGGEYSGCTGGGRKAAGDGRTAADSQIET